MNNHQVKILILEPYYGGSHKIFLDGLVRHLPYHFELLSLPARKWKWRMRLAAPYYAELLEKMAPFDCVLCSTYVDIATLKALAPTWFKKVPVICYFHENQFAYPVRQEDDRDFHFALTNLTSALAADRLAFNSEYNLSSFLEGCRSLLRKTPDMKLPDYETRIREKSSVLPPSLDFAEIDNGADCKKEKPPLIIWNHRWEHDKNPETFFKTIFALERSGVSFKLAVLGESFQRRPLIFDEARKRLAHRLVHFGYVKERREYIRWLKKGALVVSTAEHEFFGIAVLEAVRAGCRPLLPSRLSYPELFPDDFLYEDGELPARLYNSLSQGGLGRKEALRLTEKFAWENLSANYEAWLTK